MISSEECWLHGRCSERHCTDPSGCMILYKLDYLYNEANIPINLRYHQNLVTDADGTDAEEFRRLKNAQDNIIDVINSGANLYLWSSQAGNGKTSWAIRLLQSYFNKIWLKSPMTCRALYISVPYFLQALKDNISVKSDYISHIKENILKCDLVIWDDISNKIGTDFEINNLLSMIDGRLSAGKSNIYTSNIAPEDLKNYLDIRLGSRIATVSTCIQFKGGDKRGLQI